MAITPFQLTDNFTMENFNSKFNEANVSLNQMVNPNLLDNAYFGNPVNQRGGYVVPPDVRYHPVGVNQYIGTTDKYYKVDSVVTDGTVLFSIDGTQYATYASEGNKSVRGYTGAGYTIDRWYLNRGILLVESDGVHLKWDGVNGVDGYIQERFAKEYSCLYGETITLSAIIDGNLYSVTGVLSVGGANVVLSVPNGSIALTVWNTSTVSIAATLFAKTTGGIKITAAKLELGTEQTLAHQENGIWVLNEIPNYAEELAKCQRYQRKTEAVTAYGTFGLGIAYSATTLYVKMPVCGTPRKATPVLVRGGNVEVYPSSIAPTNITIGHCTNEYVDLIVTVAGGLTVGNAYILRALNDVSAYILLDYNL